MVFRMSHSLYLLGLIGAWGLLGGGAFAAESLTVGFAEEDITPTLKDKPVYLAGFGQNRKASGVHDPLSARAIVLGDGRQTLAIVSVDLIGLFHSSSERIRKALPELSYVVVCATHNHSGPDTLGLWGPNPFTSGVDRDYLARVEQACVSAIRQAHRRRQPASARIGHVALPELLRDSRLPEVKMDTLSALEFLNAEGKTLGMLVQWHCHPEVLDGQNTRITADFVGSVVRQLQEKRRCSVVYVSGAVGGLMTPLGLPLRSPQGQELPEASFAKNEEYGRRLAEATLHCLQKADDLRLTPFTLRFQQVLFPVENNLYRLGWKLGVLQRTLYRWGGDPTPQTWQEATNVSQPVGVKSEVAFLQLGELAVAVVPGEIYPELVQGGVPDPAEPGADFPESPIEPPLFTLFKARHRWIIGLGNDEIGYIIPQRQWDEKAPHCYGRKSPQYGEGNSLGPQTAPLLSRIFRQLTNP